MGEKQLTVVERAAVALGTPEHEKKLVELVKQSGSIVEIKNADGRTQCHAAYMVLKNARVDIEKAGKTAREDATAFSKAVIAEEKRLVGITAAEEARLQGLRDVWDEAREAEKRAAREAEERRLAKIQSAINQIRTTPVDFAGKTSGCIERAIATLEDMEISLEEFAEQLGHAELARTDAIKKLREMHSDALAHEEEVKRIEAERAELIRLSAEQEERERQAVIARAEEERRAREVREQEEADRREAQRRAEEAIRAERDASEAKLRAEREAHEAEMQAQRDEIARQQAEIAAERRRHAEEVEAKRRAEEEQARVEAERIREEHEAKIAEQTRREREDFVLNGPSGDEIVDVLAAHYEVTRSDVNRWLSKIEVEFDEV